MLSKIPIQPELLGKEDVGRAVLRAAIIAELDAVNLYEQMAAVVGDSDIRNVLLDVAREEKTHIGEFHALLLKFDQEQTEESRAGEREVQEKTRNGTGPALDL